MKKEEQSSQGKAKTLKEAAVKFLQAMRGAAPWRFRFCEDNGDSLIASSLAAMLGCFIGYFDALTADDKREWAGHINSFQRQDGWFEDEDISEKNLCPGYRKDRALLHRTRHALFALNALGARPRHQFHFIRHWLGQGKMRKWCEGLNLADYWYSSNMMMDAATYLMNAGLHQKNEEAWRAVRELLDFCDEHINPKTGFHDGGLSETRNAMAGAMHLYPVYILMKRPVLRIGEAIRTTISLQQADGLFGYETGQGGEDCLDYDAIMILSNLSLMDRRHEQAVKTAFQKCLQGIMVCKNIDGGFACHRRNETYYFGTKTTAVAAGKSSLWATYSRLLTIAMIMNHLYPETRPAWRLGANLLEVWDGGTGFIRKEQT